MQHDEQEIRNLVAAWMSATRSGDSEAVLDLMTEDAVFLVLGRPPFGKDAFAKAGKDQARASMTFDGRSDILEIKVCGDWAYMLTRLTVTSNQPGSKPEIRSGHTLSILQKQGGKWRLARDANLLTAATESTDGN